MGKEKQRAELQRALKGATDKLVHGGIFTPVQFMNYMLGGLFYRFVSENVSNAISGDYPEWKDSEAEKHRPKVAEEKGFFLLPSELFCNVSKQKDNLAETLEKVFKSFEDSAIGHKRERDIKGLFDDFDVDAKFLRDNTDEELGKVLKCVEELKMENFEEQSIDTFGDAYEYIISMYATDAGKKGGEFYTPREVSELLAKMTTAEKKKVRSVYDPACGTGSLLLSFAKTAESFYGQELNMTTYNLCKMNMFLHNVKDFNIARGDTLKAPQHLKDKPFDVIVSNPPYSVKWEGNDNPILLEDPRFSPAKVLAPKANADLAFVMHILYHLADDGVAAIVEFPGVLYRGNAEQKIRKYLIDNNYIDTIIQLPANLFFGTEISTCIIILKKQKADKSVLFIDASKEFIKVGKKNKLTEENATNILNCYIERKPIDHFSSLATLEEIAENDYNLSVSSYVEQKSDREVIDIKVLNAQVKEMAERRNKLYRELDELVEKLEAGLL